MTSTQDETKVNAAPAKHTVVKIPIGDLSVDMDIQRGLDLTRVEKIAKNFDPDALGSLSVSLRDDGSRAVIDGQHRWKGAEKAGYTEPLTCIQYVGLTPKEEASLFLLLNDTRSLHPVDKMRARIVHGEEDAVTMKAVLDEKGWIIRISQSDWSMSAVNSMEKVYNGSGVVKGADPTLLSNVMTIITAAWNGNFRSATAPILTSMGKFLGWYGTSVDYDKLISDLRDMPPARLIAEMKMVKEFNRVDIPNAGARVLVGIHNKGRRTGKLPEWINR